MKVGKRVAPDPWRSAPAEKLAQYLRDKCKYMVAEELPVGPYTMDIYLPELHVDIEVDGPGHSWRKDANRDKVLLDDYGIITFRHPADQKWDEVVWATFLAHDDSLDDVIDERLSLYDRNG